MGGGGEVRSELQDKLLGVLVAKSMEAAVSGSDAMTCWPTLFRPTHCKFRR
jgi:hypothetical protein